MYRCIRSEWSRLSIDMKLHEHIAFAFVYAPFSSIPTPGLATHSNLLHKVLASNQLL